MNTLPTIEPGEPIQLGQLVPEAAAEAELHLHPLALTGAVHTLIDCFANRPTELAPVLTPDTTIQLGEGEAAKRLTVLAGYRPNGDYNPQRAIYQRDLESGSISEWIVFDGGPDGAITDGTGRKLKSQDDYIFVHSVLTAMNEHYQQDIVSNTDSFDLRSFARQRLQAEEQAHELRLRTIRSQLVQLGVGQKALDTFRVSIISYWDGETSLRDEVTSSTSLFDALKQAGEKFRQLNGRSDIQGAISASVKVGEDDYLRLPAELINPAATYFAAGSDLERTYLERARQAIANKNKKSA
ncbi:MAG: hypothetical protein JWN38_88 [Candidatus Saccharibacteria bacterium]|nr:hypothetical protein [Candidatus Saccharibacteria bacterium]